MGSPFLVITKLWRGSLRVQFFTMGWGELELCAPTAHLQQQPSWAAAFICEQGASYLPSLAVACYVAHLTIEQGLSLLWKGMVLLSLLGKPHILYCKNTITQLELSAILKDAGKHYDIPCTRVQDIHTPFRPEEYHNKDSCFPVYSLECSKGERAWPLVIYIKQGDTFACLCDSGSLPGFWYLNWDTFECFRKNICLFCGFGVFF